MKYLMSFTAASLSIMVMLLLVLLYLKYTTNFITVVMLLMVFGVIWTLAHLILFGESESSGWEGI